MLVDTIDCICLMIQKTFVDMMISLDSGVSDIEPIADLTLVIVKIGLESI